MKEEGPHLQRHGLEPFDRANLPPSDLLANFADYIAIAEQAYALSSRLQRAVTSVKLDTLDAYVTNVVRVDLARVRELCARGAVFASPHYGPFAACSLLFGWLAKPENPAHVFYDPPSTVPANQRYDEIFARFAGRLTVLHNDSRGLIDAMRALRRGQSLAIMFDVVQNPADSIAVPFFDRFQRAMPGAAFLAMQSGCPLIPVFALPETGFVNIVLGEPINPPARANLGKEQIMFDMTCSLYKSFEAQLRSAPWHWLYWWTVANEKDKLLQAVLSGTHWTNSLGERINRNPEVAAMLPRLAQLMLPRAAHRKS